MLLQHLHAPIFAPASDLLGESNSSICSQLETKSRGGSVAPLSMRPDSPPPPTMMMTTAGVTARGRNKPLPAFASMAE